MEENQDAAEMQLPDELWGEIGRLVDQPDFLETQIALARTSKQTYAVFGGYLFAPDQAALDAALAHKGQAKAIVLTVSGLLVSRAPASVTPQGQPTPNVSLGSATAITSGSVSIRKAAVTASDDAYVDASSGPTVTASGDARVYAYSGSVVTASGNAYVEAFSGSTVTASGNAEVHAHPGSTVTASGTAQVKAYAGSTVTGQGSQVVIFSLPGAKVNADDPRTVRQATEDDKYLTFAELEAKYPAP